AEWTSGNTYSYVRMAEGADVASLVPLTADIISRNVETIHGQGRPEDNIVLSFIPVTDIWLYSETIHDMRGRGDINTVYAFSGIALLILLIAGFNYVNLATARAMRRAREVGMRKVVGASRGQLIGQFLGESLVLTSIALVLAVALAEMVLPAYSTLLGKEAMTVPYGDPLFLLALAGLGLGIGIGGGLYPAFYLASFRPIGVLRSSGLSQAAMPKLRSALVLLQFAAATGIIISTLVVANQTLFANNKDLGFDKEGMLLLGNLGRNNLLDQAATLEQELSRIPGVTGTTISQFVPGDTDEWNTFFQLRGASAEPVLLNLLSADYDFFETYGIELKTGRFLSEDRRSEAMTLPEENQRTTAAAILNETAVRALGFASAEEAVGKIVDWDIGSGRVIEFTIAGTVGDIHIRSVYHEIRPMIYFRRGTMFETMSLRFKTDDMPAFLVAVDATWKRLIPDVPIARSILDERFDAFYASERTLTKVFIMFAVLASLVSAIGLLGLASFAAERRTKEIGLRKTLGATSAQIVRLLVWQFSKPVLLANIIAWPVAGYFMNDWLQGFAYRMELTPLPFLLAGGAALLIAWATVAGHAAKVARANPITALRYE
ncbi:MAG: FtsX-like permease family protein, partial [Sphingomonadales bacterium]